MICKILGKWIMEASSKSWVHHLSQGEDEEVADGLNDNSTMVSQKMGLHSYVDKEITFVGSNDIVKYARGEHTQLNIGWKVHPKYGFR